MNIIQAARDGYEQGRKDERRGRAKFDMNELCEWKMEHQLAFLAGHEIGRSAQTEISKLFVTCGSCGARVARGDACSLDMCGAVIMQEESHG